jgi:2-(1,2-epoxy-1,2-dihydrophenyl)acetyl-CoA isomerase
MSETPPIIEERDGKVAILTLNNPTKLNALSLEIRNRLIALVPELVRDPEVGCILITGAGRGFSSGGDFSTSNSTRSAVATRESFRAAHIWIRELVASETMVVTAVNGPAAGAGFGLAMLGDYILCSDQAFFRAGFPSAGLAPDYGIGWTLPRAVGSVRAREILMGNRKIDAVEAERIGLVTRVVDPDALLPEARRLAAALAHGAPRAMAATKHALDRAWDIGLDEALDDEARRQGELGASADHAEGLAAFREKRPPRFTGS